MRWLGKKLLKWFYDGNISLFWFSYCVQADQPSFSFKRSKQKDMQTTKQNTNKPKKSKQEEKKLKKTKKNPNQWN